MKFSLEPIDENALYLTVGTVVTEELWVAIAKRIEAIARVRELHYKATSMFHLQDVEICGWCSSICPHEVDSDVYWPCDTIRALDNNGIWFKEGEQ